MESGAALELVFASGLVVVPVDPILSVVCPPTLVSRGLLDIHLLATKDETLLCWVDALLLLDTLLDARDL